MKEVAIISIIAIVGILILTGIEIWLYQDDYMFSKEHEEQTKERRRRIEKRNYNWRNSTRKPSEMSKAKCYHYGSAYRNEMIEKYEKVLGELIYDKLHGKTETAESDRWSKKGLSL